MWEAWEGIMRTTAAWLSLMVAVLCPFVASAQSLGPDGPDYYQEGEVVAGFGTIMDCRIPDSAMTDPDALAAFEKRTRESMRRFTKPHRIKLKVTEDYSRQFAPLASVLWQNATLSDLEESYVWFDKAVVGCIRRGDCPAPDNAVDKIYKHMHKSRPYKRYMSKALGETPPDTLIAQRYLMYGACSIPRRVDLGAHLPEFVTGDFPAEICDFARDGIKDERGWPSKEHDLSIPDKLRWESALELSRGLDRHGDPVEDGWWLGERHSCPILPKEVGDKVLAHAGIPQGGYGRLSRSDFLAYIAERAGTLGDESAKRVAAAVAMDEKIRERRFQYLRDRRAKIEAMVPDDKAFILKAYADPEKEFANPESCSNIIRRAVGMKRYEDSMIWSARWKRILEVDLEWACAHIPQEVVETTFPGESTGSYAWNSKVPSGPSTTRTHTDYGKAISDAAAAWSQQQQARTACQMEYGFTDLRC